MFVEAEVEPVRSVECSQCANQCTKAWHPPLCHHPRDAAIALAWACVVMTPILGTGALLIYSDWRKSEEARLVAINAAQAYERIGAEPPAPMLDVDEAAHGRDLFMSTCIACHGPAGTGIDGLGKTLVESDFVAGMSDALLLQFLATGRPDARPLAMPARGGRIDLTDDDLRAIVTYLRGLQDPRRMPKLPEIVAAAPTEEQQAEALDLAGGDAELAAWIANGDTLFHSTCIACHGKGGVGVAGNGKALVTNSFIGGLDDDGLLAFIKQGRSPSDPLNTTGIQMPPKGGNPALSDDDILDIISYLRTLQGDGPDAAAGS